MVLPILTALWNPHDNIMTTAITSCCHSRHMKQYIWHYFWITLSHSYKTDVISCKTLSYFTMEIWLHLCSYIMTSSKIGGYIQIKSPKCCQINIRKRHKKCKNLTGNKNLASKRLKGLINSGEGILVTFFVKYSKEQLLKI